MSCEGEDVDEDEGEEDEAEGEDNLESQYEGEDQVESKDCRCPWLTVAMFWLHRCWRAVVYDTDSPARGVRYTTESQGERWGGARWGVL